MSLAPHFDQRPVAGFARPNFSAQAGRQFQLSLGLVIILGLAALGVTVSGLIDTYNSAGVLAQLASLH